MCLQNKKCIHRHYTLEDDTGTIKCIHPHPIPASLSPSPPHPRNLCPRPHPVTAQLSPSPPRSRPVTAVHYTVRSVGLPSSDSRVLQRLYWLFGMVFVLSKCHCQVHSVTKLLINISEIHFHY